MLSIAVFRKYIFSKLLPFVLLCLSSCVAALFDQCNHLVELQSGQKMYINSPYYPRQYPIGSSCRYTLIAPKDHQLKFKCNINLNSQSSSPRCTDEIFYFNREGSELLSGSEFFCGSVNVERKSFLNRAIISYISTPGYSRSSIESGETEGHQQQNETTSTMTTLMLTNMTTLMATNLMTSTVATPSLATVVKPDTLVPIQAATTTNDEKSGVGSEQVLTSVASVASSSASATLTTPTSNRSISETTTETTTKTSVPTTTTTLVQLPAIFLTVTPNLSTSTVPATTTIKSVHTAASTTTTTSPMSSSTTITSFSTSIVANSLSSNIETGAVASITTESTAPKKVTITHETTTTTTPLMEIYTTPALLELEKAAAPLNKTTNRPTSFLSYFLASMGWRSDFLRIPLYRIFTITPYRRTPYQGVAPNHVTSNNISPHRESTLAGAPYHGIPHHGAPYRDVPYRGVAYSEGPYNGVPYRGVPYRGTPFLNVPYRITRIVGGNKDLDVDLNAVPSPAPLSPKLPTIANTLASTYAAGGGSFSCLVEAIEPPCECGWSTIPKVAGQADEAGINEFPSMAGVLSVKYNKIFCGATIIHHRYLISAAHCFLMPEAENAQNIRIVVGEHDLSTVIESLYTRFYDIESIIVHENFITTSNSVRNDIALLRTSMDIEWNRSVGPACLPFRPIFGANGSQKPPMVGQRLDTAGWGTTTFGGSQSTRLLKTTLDVIDRDECKRSVYPVPSGTFCTYTPGKDTCQYDSGGALYMRDSRLYAVGIVSYGFACASNQPSVNTKISVFMKWIRSKTPEVTYCMK